MYSAQTQAHSQFLLSAIFVFNKPRFLCLLRLKFKRLSYFYSVSCWLDIYKLPVISICFILHRNRVILWLSYSCKSWLEALWLFFGLRNVVTMFKCYHTAISGNVLISLILCRFISNFNFIRLTAFKHIIRTQPHKTLDIFLALFLLGFHIVMDSAWLSLISSW